MRIAGRLASCHLVFSFQFDNDSCFFFEPDATDTDLDLDPGNDPDSVSGETIPERALKAVGTKPGVKHEGSVKDLIEDQKDLEIASVALNPAQVKYDFL